MAPDERKKQERWAQSIVQKTASCPEWYEWDRIENGYHCQGGHHLITDELLAEGKGGVYAVPLSHRIDFYMGPYYPDPDHPEYFPYCGPKLKDELRVQKWLGIHPVHGHAHQAPAASAHTGGSCVVGHGPGKMGGATSMSASIRQDIQQEAVEKIMSQFQGLGMYGNRMRGPGFHGSRFGRGPGSMGFGGQYGHGGSPGFGGSHRF